MRNFSRCVPLDDARLAFFQNLRVPKAPSSLNKPSPPGFERRQTLTIELPLDEHTRILNPEQVILKVADKYIDIGALCYTSRSDKRRKQGQPQEVVISSFNKSRRQPILQIIKALSSLTTDGGKSLNTVGQYARLIRNFINWSDENNRADCVAGGEATYRAFHAWSLDTHERYRKQQFNDGQHNTRLTYVCELLEATTDVEQLMQGVRKATRKNNSNRGTEPLAVHDFAHAVALNQCLFDGLCDLVLENRPFPFKLDLPKSLGWTDNYLWLFPNRTWRLLPHLRDDGPRRKRRSNANWAYQYDCGRIATVDEIEHKYSARDKTQRRCCARSAIRSATAKIEEANSDVRHTSRLTLGTLALRAFMFLFVCNTGGNQQVVLDLETNGQIEASVQNQKFRALKWRAGAKEVILIAPATFMPRLRRFMELRKYLLQGQTTPFLFFGYRTRNNKPPSRCGTFELDNLYRRHLREIDPRLPKMGPRALRASVDDYYLRVHDSVVAAAVMGHTVETEHSKYCRGSPNDHHEEISRFMAAVSESARRQRVIPIKAAASCDPPLATGGYCERYGRPQPLIRDAPVQPDCKKSQGCMFCSHRVLIAEEEDARKVASAAYVMEQLVLGPKHEEALRPLIAKCDEDLEKISSFPNCRLMVEKVRRDVYENENLTPYWADKFQLILELGVIS